MRVITLLAAMALSSQAGAATMMLSSTDVAQGKTMSNAQVFNGFGCTGENISPQLTWKNAPKDTKSFALTVYDPDAPTGSGWWHWVMVNIPASVNQLPANAGNPEAALAPAGTQNIRTDFGTYGFGGACPPVGDKPHRYQFTIFALDVEKLELPVDATAALAGFYIHAHTIGKATLEAKYGR